LLPVHKLEELEGVIESNGTGDAAGR
jgi:hypothetical protein